MKDTSTGLVWDRYAYYIGPVGNQAQADAFCQGQGARLPTKDEALAISGASDKVCAWPCLWSTWTSTPAGAGLAWVVDQSGAREVDVDYAVGYVLCVR